MKPGLRSSRDYDVTMATETESPEIAREAWRVHAASYLQAGFVTAAATTDEGFLRPQIDRAWGSNVTYYLATERATGRPVATIRKVPLGGDGVAALPAYEHCEASLAPSGRQLLHDLSRSGELTHEVAALASLGAPDAMYELVRRVILDGRRRRETWFVGLVESTRTVLEARLGRTNFVSVGRPSPIVAEGVPSSVRLVPTVIRCDGFVERIEQCVHEARGPAALRLERTLAAYRNGQAPIVLATDAAGDGRFQPGGDDVVPIAPPAARSSA